MILSTTLVQCSIMTWFYQPRKVKSTLILQYLKIKTKKQHRVFCPMRLQGRKFWGRGESIDDKPQHITSTFILSIPNKWKTELTSEGFEPKPEYIFLNTLTTLLTLYFNRSGYGFRNKTSNFEGTGQSSTLPPPTVLDFIDQK